MRGMRKRSKCENWSERGFYSTMRCLFLPKKPTNRTPFFQQDSGRRLTQAQYEGVRDLYVASQRQKYLSLLQKRTRSGVEEPESSRWPAPLPGEEPFTVTPAQKALGRLYFAQSRTTQQQARKEVRQLATKGKHAARVALSAAVAATPQVKASFSKEELLARYIRARQGR